MLLSMNDLRDAPACAQLSNLDFLFDAWHDGERPQRAPKPIIDEALTGELSPLVCHVPVRGQTPPHKGYASTF